MDDLYLDMKNNNLGTIENLDCYFNFELNILTNNYRGKSILKFSSYTIKNRYNLDLVSWEKLYFNNNEVLYIFVTTNGSVYHCRKKININFC